MLEISFVSFQSVRFSFLLISLIEGRC